MQFTPITLADNVYEVQEEAHLGGLEDIVGIFLQEDVLTLPTFGATATGDITANEAILTASGPLVFKTGKKATKLFSIIEKNSGETKLVGRSGYLSDFKITVQNTQENRGFLENLRKLRFMAYLKESSGDGMLLGKPGVTTGYLAYIKPDSISVKTGEKFGDERMIEFVISAAPFAPYTYNETFSFAPGA